MIKRRANKSRWISLPPNIFEDSRLSYKALGIAAYLLSKPDDWEVRVSHLVDRQDKDGLTSVRAGIKELSDAGYMSLERIQDTDSGQHFGQRYVIQEEPEIQQAENRALGLPNARKRAPLTYDLKDLPNLEKRSNLKKRKNAREEEVNLDNGKTEEGGKKTEEKAGLATGEERLDTPSLATHSACTFWDPMFVCEHVREALETISAVLERSVRKPRRGDFHEFVHDHGPADVRILTEYAKLTLPPDKLTIDFIFAGDSAEAKLVVATEALEKEKIDSDPFIGRNYKGAEVLLMSTKGPGILNSLRADGPHRDHPVSLKEGSVWCNECNEHIPDEHVGDRVFKWLDDWYDTHRGGIRP